VRELHGAGQGQGERDPDWYGACDFPQTEPSDADQCDKVSLLFEGVIGSCDIVNSKKTKVQVTGEAPAIQVDRSHGLTIYLSRESSAINIFTVLSTEVNVVTESEEIEGPQVCFLMFCRIS